MRGVSLQPIWFGRLNPEDPSIACLVLRVGLPIQTHQIFTTGLRPPFRSTRRNFDCQDALARYDGPRERVHPRNTHWPLANMATALVTYPASILRNGKIVVGCMRLSCRSFVCHKSRPKLRHRASHRANRCTTVTRCVTISNCDEWLSQCDLLRQRQRSRLNRLCIL